MNKVICDICGTSYPDTSETCPICGYSRIYGDDKPDNSYMSGDVAAADELYYKPVKKGKGIFDYDAEEGTDNTEDVYLDQEQEELEVSRDPAPNYFAVILLVVLITLLVVATGFLFFRYFMPNMFTETTAPTMPTEIVAAEAEKTEEPTEAKSAIPCERIALIGGLQALSKEGQMWLLHVKVTPEDTTDSITYSSEDESVATVNENGRITAVSEGETVITIRCGNQSIACPVVVDYSAATEPVQEGTIPPIKLSEEEETTSQPEPEETEATTEAEETHPEETTQETEAEDITESTEPKQVTLKLKKSDISFGRPGVSFTLELDCDLDPTEVTWFTNNPNVALIRDGVVTALGTGTTKVFAKYGDQQVECIVRCNF